MKTTKLAASLEKIITTLPTYDQRMTAYGILDLLTENEITEREALKYLAANKIVVG